MTQFLDHVSTLSDKILSHEGDLLSIDNTYTEAEVMEAYRLALKKGGVSKLSFLIDSTLKTCDSSKIPYEFVFEMFSDAVDMSTVKECETIVWGQLESRSAQFFKLAAQDRSKLALLKVANELLRRLSQTQDPILCGRVLTLLANTIPLDDKSGFNMNGSYNRENETRIEKQEEFVLDGNSAKDFSTYERFWKLQHFFSQKFDEETVKKERLLQEFRQCLETTFDAFESHKLSSAEKQDLSTSPKYLTTGRLFQYQLSDPKLRKQVLTQTLFFLRQMSIVVKVVPGKDELQESIANWRRRAEKILSEIKPDGETFKDLIVGYVNREITWENWKKELQNKQTQPPPVKESQGKDEGAAELDDMQVENGVNSVIPLISPPKWTQLTKIENWRQQLAAKKQIKQPDDEDEFKTYAKPMIEALDPDSGIEDAYHPKHDLLYCFRGLRMARMYKLDSFKVKFDGKFDRLVAKYYDIKEAEPPSLASSTATPAIDASPAGESIPELPSPSPDIGSEALSSNNPEEGSPIETEDEDDINNGEGQETKRLKVEEEVDSGSAVE